MPGDCTHKDTNMQSTEHP